MSLFAHAGQVLLHSLLRNPITQPLCLHCSAFPMIEAAPSQHWPLHKDSSVPHTNKTHSYIFIKNTHTHIFIALQVSQTQSREWMPVFFPCCYELNKKAQWSWASWCCEVWAEPWTYWPIPFNPLFVEPPIYLVSLLLPLCQLQLFWVWKHIQKWLQH